jgi:bla regulator protein blaR1
VKSGREFEAICRAGQRAGVTERVGLVVSNSAIEPGILGIFDHVLLLPSGITDRLTEAQLEAIITHELCHVRRRDNLAAAVHMFVEGLFWFHPSSGGSALP